MTKPSDKVEISYKKLHPHQIGWLRRKELDREGIEVWEQPDGGLFAHNPKCGPLVVAKRSMPKGFWGK